MSMPTLTSDQMYQMLGRFRQRRVAFVSPTSCWRDLPVFAPVHGPGPRALGLTGFVEVTALEGDPYLPAGDRYLLLQFGGASGGVPGAPKSLVAPAPVVE